MGKTKVQIIRRTQEVYEFEIDEEASLSWEIRDKIQKSINNGTLEEAKEFNLELLETKILDTTYPIGDNFLEVQNHKENMLIVSEFMRIWSEYPRESFMNTIHELARTIHEEGKGYYESYLAEDFYQKYYTNNGTEENPDYVEIEDLWSERWKAEYNAIYLMIFDMTNEELLASMKKLVEFIGY